ncbi:MAG: hypothetical protein ACYS5V_09585 [Planctomycetota bacterium]
MPKTLLAAVLAAALSAGCAATRPPLCVTGDKEFDAIWDASRSVLSEYRFVVDRSDLRAGIITTYPMVGRHWFEPWRQDAPTSRLAAMHSLHTIWQTVTVTVCKAEDVSAADGRLARYTVGVQVDMRRSTRPTYQVTSTADAYDMFVGRKGVARSFAMYEGAGAKPGTAEEIGRNKPLEAVLAKKILSRAAKSLTIYTPSRPRQAGDPNLHRE